MCLDNFVSNVVPFLLRLKSVETEIIDAKGGQAFLPEHASDYI